MLNLALFISDLFESATATAIANACRQTQPLNGLVRPVLLVSSTADSPEIKKLHKAGLKDGDTIVLNFDDYDNDEAKFGQRLIEVCEERQVNFFAQYGWRQPTPDNLLEAFPGRGITQHLAPVSPGNNDFGGKFIFGMGSLLFRLRFVQKTHREYWTTVVAQRADPEFNQGMILREQRVDIFPHSDTVQKIAKRAMSAAADLHIDTLRAFAKGGSHAELNGARLVLPAEAEIWGEAYREAFAIYPNG